MDYRTAGERYDEARIDRFREFEDTRPLDPKDVAAYDAICDLQFKAFDEYSATFGPAESAIPLNRWSDCLCRRCMGATMVSEVGEHGAVWSTCPECFGTGVEGPYILEGRE